MALIDLLSLSKHYEAQKILTQIDFHLNEGERICIVGKNGSGKSTLLKIVQGILDFDEGERITRQDLEVKMLAQQPHFRAGINVREAIMDGLVEIRHAQERYEVLNAQLMEDFENPKLLEEHAKVCAYLDHHNAWNLDDKIERILQEFDLKMFEDKSVHLLSGGEQRRVAFASLLLQKPDVLLLDEPTNHLDVYMVSFLEELLLKENFTLVFISHDRYFIDQIATRTIEVEDAKVTNFSGGYSSYLAQKEIMLSNMQKEHENLLRVLRRENEWYSQGVRARLKRNEGRKARLMDLRQKSKSNPTLIRKVSLQLEREQKHFMRPEGVNKQKMLFEIEHLSMQLGGKKLIDNFSFRILQKDVIAVVGHNGSGKSTLLRILLGRLKPTSGTIKQGEFVIGYFDQHREMLDDSKNLMETFCPNGGDRVDVQGTNMHVFGYLKNFLFPKEDLDKKIGVLSGGEKNRVALALLFTKKVDCLILDEPTNDLDIPTINILEEKLQNFSGAIIMVSHDRYFIDKIASKLLIFKGNGVLEERYQAYSEYLEIEKELKELALMEAESAQSMPAPSTSVAPTTVQKAKTKLSFTELHALKTLPIEIEKLEGDVAKLTLCLSDPNCYAQKGLSTLAQELQTLQAHLDEKSEYYLELLEKEEASLA
ncbi:MAG: ABC transporter ATP-binding protein [Sulfurovum sp. PC08-66]|nr:MAG: ABC transporter ATP-binding protein [Sulfurovum sp. PC08-66]KIM12391.1 MAG: ABC transporter ATP-binding protein [Sulfuricurvum sp. PC08-66]